MMGSLFKPKVLIGTFAGIIGRFFKMNENANQIKISILCEEFKSYADYISTTSQGG